jgi:hypothetical protein
MVSRKSRRGLVIFFVVIILLVVFVCSLRQFGITGGAIITLNPKDKGDILNISFAGGGISNDATYSRKNYGSGSYGN